LYQKKTQQLIPATLDEVWAFIASPRNLAKITPTYMNFRVTNEPIAEHMYPGQIIAYKVSPVAGLPLRWVTEITHVEEKKYFVDEQRQGPYKMWHHEHHIEAAPGGVLMQDIVSYALPLGPLGTLAHSLFVRRQLDEIFDFRHRAIEQQFGKIKQP